MSELRHKTLFPPGTGLAATLPVKPGVPCQARVMPSFNSQSQALLYLAGSSGQTDLRQREPHH
mgnify:CR=1 FL=1